MNRTAGNYRLDDPDADGLLPKSDTDYADCRTCGFEFSKTVLLGGLCPRCATKYMTAHYHQNHPVDDLSSDSKTDCLKPCACRAGAVAGK